MARPTTLLTTLLACAAAAAFAAPGAQAKPASLAYALSGGALRTFDPVQPSSATFQPISGITAGETLVGIDVRPANGMLYGLGVNATTNTGTLYVISRDAFASPVGVADSIAFTTDGVTVIDLPAGDYGVDFNPVADRIRVVTSTGLSFRVNPTTGTAIDGNNGGGGGTVTGTNPDGPINGATTGAGGAAYTNSGSNLATATTLYALDAATDHLTIQTPPNNGTQTSPLALTSNGAPLNATAVPGFDVDPAVAVTASNTAATGDGYALLTVGGSNHLYKIALTTGAATDLGTVGDGSGTMNGLALQRDLGDGGHPTVGLVSGGTTLRRFMTGAPGSGVDVPVTGVQLGEILVGIAWRPATGQLLALGADTTADTGTLYVIDPSTSPAATATAIGAPGQVGWVGADGSTVVDLPSALAGWGIDVNPTTDRVRVVAAGGLNARVNPVTGAPIDGNLGQASPPTGTQPDAPHNGAATSVTSTSYTNAFAQALGAGATTQYALDPAGNQLLIQNPPNAGTLVAGRALSVSCGGTLDFDAVTALDLPGSVRVDTAGAEAITPETGYAALTVGGTPGLYSISLFSGYAKAMGTLPAPLAGLAVGEAVGYESIAIPSCPPPSQPPGPTANPNPGPPPGPNPPTTPKKDTVAPRVTGLTVKARSKRRLTIAFTTSEAGKATILLQRRVAGRRDGRKRCVTSRKKGTRCTLYKSYKSVTEAIAKPGKVTVGATGRSGAVRVVVTVRDGTGNTSRATTRSATVRH
jgi:hypothetical protein